MRSNRQTMKRVIPAAALILLVSCSAKEDPAFVRAELEWREARDQAMREQSSWLTIAGLFWLQEGANTFGTNPSNRFQLPQGSAPDFAGSFVLEAGEVKVIPAPGAVITIEGEAVGERTLRSDTSRGTDTLELNDLRLWIIERSDRIAIRMRDFNEPRFLEYAGLDFYPPTSEFRFAAEFVPYESPKRVEMSTVVGTTTASVSPGYVKFQLDGVEYTLDAFRTGRADMLHFVFRDETSGYETYGASRFMDSRILEDGTVDLNFNRAHNPPCAYTPHATCPLPPPQNILPVRIEAGEKNYPGAQH
jgi:uncharacterized protein (DUF1684 family)